MYYTAISGLQLIVCFLPCTGGEADWSYLRTVFLMKLDDDIVVGLLTHVKSSELHYLSNKPTLVTSAPQRDWRWRYCSRCNRQLSQLYVSYVAKKCTCLQPYLDLCSGCSVIASNADAPTFHHYKPTHIPSNCAMGDFVRDADVFEASRQPLITAIVY